MRRLLILAAVAAVAATLFAASLGFSPAPNTAVGFNNRGEAYRAKAQYERAIADFDEAIHLDPKLAAAFYNRGLAYGSKDQYDRAIADFDEAIRLDPKFVFAFNGRGDVYTLKAQYDRAIADFDQAIRLDPKYSLAFLGRGAAYGHEAEYDRAIADFDQAIRLDPKYAFGFIGRGGVYVLKAQYDRAIADFDQALRLDPQQAVTFTGRGVANFNTGQFAAAADDFEESLSLDARDGDVVLWLHLARARSNRDDAQELASNARMVDPKTWPGPILAYYLGRVDADEVMRAAGNGSADMPRNQSCQAYFFVGEDAVLRQDIDEADRLLRQARDTCALDSFKRAAAEFELKRLPK